MSIATREIRLKSRPTGLPTPDNFELAEARLETPAAGQLLVRNIWMSVDPYMRGRMVDRPTYIAPFSVGAALEGAAIGVVVETGDAGFAPGDTVVHFAGWREHALIEAAGASKADAEGIAPQAWLGALGFPGLTAYAGLIRIADIKAGQTIFVSAASGAVGAVVCQIARIRGLRVVASAGSADKVQWLREVAKVDAVINYRETDDISAALVAEAPEGIDVYFDNVGGGHLEAALAAANTNARFVLCGMISGYNSATPSTGPANIFLAVEKRIRLEGIIGADHFDMLADFQRDVSNWLRAGDIRVQETIVDGLASAPAAFIGLFSGRNRGKMLVRLG